MEAILNAADDWEWPEEKPSSSNYYNSAFGGVPPDPKKLAASLVTEEEDPCAQPFFLLFVPRTFRSLAWCDGLRSAKRVTMVRNYSWSDDTDSIRVYVPVPGVVREQVTVDIGDDKVDLSAQTPSYGLFTMSLRRLFDKVDVAKSSFKVLEKKEKVIITLRKFPPPRYGEDSYVEYKQWYAPLRSCHAASHRRTHARAVRTAQVPIAPRRD